MEDEPEDPPKRYPLSPAKMSKTPSWVMLGFILGALTVISLPPLRREKPSLPPREVSLEPPRRQEPPAPPQLTTVEAVFAEWGENAVWSDGTTEVALWNTDRRSFSDFFEVRRYGGTYYFRSIPSLTRRIITRGKPMPDSPLQFTETEEQYQEWRQHGRSERPLDPGTRPRASELSRPATPQVQVTRPVVAPPTSDLVSPNLAPPSLAPESAKPGR